MKEELFNKKNLEKWQRLDSLNKVIAKKGIEKLTKDEIKEYTGLYRLAGHHLAYSKTHFNGSKTQIYLNSLLGVSHNNFYTKENSALSEFFNYFKKTFPQKLLEHKIYFIISICVFVFGAVLCYVLSGINSDIMRIFVPINNISLSQSEKTVDYPFLSSFVMTNNIRVSFMAFSFGITFGLGTLYVLFYNGAMLGALTNYIHGSGGSMLAYFSLILPHGFIELTAIFISGAAGLMLGKAMLIPGDLSRKHAIIKNAKEAAYLLPGVVAMLIIAGIIEGFFTPLDISPNLKLGFAVITLVALIFYFYPRTDRLK